MEGGAVGLNIEKELPKDHGGIPAKFAFIWFRSFREDLNVIFYKNNV